MSSDSKPTTSDSLPPPAEDKPGSVKVTCHCKRIEIVMPSRPEQLNECHCTICYAYGALWAYFPRKEITVTAKEGATIASYIRDDGPDMDGGLSFNRCSHCGCTTHWWGEGPYANEDRKMGINCRMLPENDIADIKRKQSMN